MKYMFIRKIQLSGAWEIHVEGFPREQFHGYSRRDAIKRYRMFHGLRHKKFQLVEV